MARQKGHLLIEGTINGFTYYKLKGKHYVRKKSTFSRKKLQEGAEFENFRMHAKLFGEASRIASQVYKGMDETTKRQNPFGTMIAKAKALLLEGKNKEEVVEILRQL